MDRLEPGGVVGQVKVVGEAGLYEVAVGVLVASGGLRVGEWDLIVKVLHEVQRLKMTMKLINLNIRAGVTTKKVNTKNQKSTSKYIIR